MHFGYLGVPWHQLDHSAFVFSNFFSNTLHYKSIYLVVECKVWNVPLIFWDWTNKFRQTPFLSSWQTNVWENKYCFLLEPSLHIIDKTRKIANNIQVFTIAGSLHHYHSLHAVLLWFVSLAPIVLLLTLLPPPPLLLSHKLSSALDLSSGPQVSELSPHNIWVSDCLFNAKWRVYNNKVYLINIKLNT